MNVLALNGSPNMESGNTAMILDPFLEGMKDSGAKVDLFYTKRLKIQPCNGDMSCWLKHPGECSQRDDMDILYPKFREADVIVWASPVYYAGVTGPIKNLMDRQLPLITFGEPGTKRQKIVLVASCASWEMDMFEPLLVQMKALYQRSEGGSDFAGALLRPHADLMKDMMKTDGRELVESVFQAAREAGRQLIDEGMMAEETLRGVSRELVPQDVFFKAAAELIQQAQQARESLKR
jgi:hypothetical protein